MNMQELQSNLTSFKQKLNMHLIQRNSANLNESYMQWLESNIESIKAKVKVLKDIENNNLLKKVG